MLPDIYRFEQAISAGRVSAVQKIENCCVLAAVGQGMVERKGSAATMMSALANADINIKAIAQVGMSDPPSVKRVLNQSTNIWGMPPRMSRQTYRNRVCCCTPTSLRHPFASLLLLAFTLPSQVLSDLSVVCSVAASLILLAFTLPLSFPPL